MRIAIITDGVVDTVAVVNKIGDYQPPAGSIAVQVDETVGSGDLYDGKTFTRPIPPPDTATLGQIIDIAVQLGVVTVQSVVDLLPSVDKVDVTQDPDGSIVVLSDKVDAVVQDAVDTGAVPPTDIPPTPDS